ncbi:MAG: EamA family transporter [Kiritimatiellia bacterium]
MKLDWTVWILLSAVFLALYDLAKKASVRNNAVLPTLLISTFCGGGAFIASAAIFGDVGAMLHPGGRVLALAAAKSVIVATSWILTFCALRTLPITIATPIRACAPAIVFVAAFFCYGEVPNWIQAIGMLFVFGGYWVFSWAGRHEGIDFLRNRAVWCAVGGMCCSACSSLWDKYVFQVCAAPVAVVQFWFQIGLFVIYATLLTGRTLLGLRHDPFEWRWTIPCVGVLLALADWLYFTGLAIPDVPISVGSLLRRVSVVITFALGARFFHETNLRRKALALAAILVGVALLTLRM